MGALFSLNFVRTATSVSLRGVVLLAAVILCGCVHTGGMQPPIAPFMVGPEKAMVLLSPGSPEALTIVQQNYSNAVEQTIYLKTEAQTSGQNYIKVRYWGPVGIKYEARERLPYVAFRQTLLSAEIWREFPSTPMAISPDYLQNDYGAFSYAVGKGLGNDMCFYGWQQIRVDDADRSVFGDTGMIQVRMRLCEAGGTQSSLLSLMYHFSLTGAFDSPAWNPYGAPPRLAANVGQPGQPIYPVGKQAELDRPVATQPQIMRDARPVSVKRAPLTTQPSLTTPVTLSPAAAPAGYPAPQIPSPAVRSPAGQAAADAKRVPPTMNAAGTGTAQTVVIPAPPCVRGSEGATCQ